MRGNGDIVRFGNQAGYVDTVHGDAMTDAETTGKRVRVNRVVIEMDEESMDEGWGCGLETDERVVQDWERGEKESVKAREKEGSQVHGGKAEHVRVLLCGCDEGGDIGGADEHEMGGREEVDDDDEELMRSRLVARDFRPRRGGSNRPNLFAAMLPLEAKKMPFIKTVAGSAFEKC